MFSKNVSICFPEGRNKAFTLSYDDGNVLDKKLVSMMRRYGVRGTFNLFSSAIKENDIKSDIAWNPMPLSEAVALYGDDMEIAIHGAEHPYWNRMPTAKVMEDIIRNRQELERATGRIIRGAAYPYGAYTDDVVEILRLAGIAYCRTVEETATNNSKLRLEDTDWFRYGGTCHHDSPELMMYADEFMSVDNHAQALYLFYVWGHSFEFEVNDNWNVMEQLLKKVSGHDEVWYATNIEIVDYLNAAKLLRWNLDETMAENPTGTVIWIRLKYPDSEPEYLSVSPGQKLFIPRC